MLHKDEWLSQYFEKGAYRVEAPYQESHVSSRFLYSKVPVENLKDAHTLEQNGFNIVEVFQLFDQKKFCYREIVEPFHIDFAHSEDRDAVLEIAANAFTSSRFYQDPAIPHSLACQIKSDWVSNYFTGQRGDEMIVAREHKKAVGFLLLIHKSVIDLIAVSQSYKGKGIASSMIQFANQNKGLLKAGTQLINKSSVNLYNKSGFSLIQSHYIFHKHGR